MIWSTLAWSWSNLEDPLVDVLVTSRVAVGDPLVVLGEDELLTDGELLDLVGTVGQRVLAVVRRRLRGLAERGRGPWP